MICYSNFNQTNLKPVSLDCGHQFCSLDWEGYLIQRVNEGFLSCM